MNRTLMALALLSTSVASTAQAQAPLQKCIGGPPGSKCLPPSTDEKITKCPRPAPRKLNLPGDLANLNLVVGLDGFKIDDDAISLDSEKGWNLNGEPLEVGENYSVMDETREPKVEVAKLVFEGMDEKNGARIFHLKTRDGAGGWRNTATWEYSTMFDDQLMFTYTNGSGKTAHTLVLNQSLASKKDPQAGRETSAPPITVEENPIGLKWDYFGCSSTVYRPASGQADGRTRAYEIIRSGGVTPANGKEGAEPVTTQPK